MTKIALADATTVHHVWHVGEGQTEIVTRYTLPNGDQISPVILGWSDDTYAVLPVIEFDVPAGKQIAGAPSYAVSNGSVVESYAVEDIPPPLVPDRVTSRQFKLALLANGMLDDVEAWIATQDRAIQIAYANSGTFVRDEPMIQAGFAALGFSPAQIDAFFMAAEAI